MTVHSQVDYKCNCCNTHFIPIPESPNCPQCNQPSEILFGNFIKDTITSAQFNVTKYQNFIPPAWLACTTGDHYYSIAFAFLDYVSCKIKTREPRLLSKIFSEYDIDSLTTQFLELLDFVDQPYRFPGLKTYLSLLLHTE